MGFGLGVLSHGTPPERVPEEEPALWARLALRSFVNERTARALGGPAPFLAKRARKVVSVTGVPVFARDKWTDFDAWNGQVLRPNAVHLIDQLLDAGDVRQLAELAMPGSRTEYDAAPAPLIPVARYRNVERVTYESRGAALTITVAADGETLTLWVGYV